MKPSPESLRKADRAARRVMLAWCLLSVAVYWLSGHDFTRSPALGWLTVIAICGALLFGIITSIAVNAANLNDPKP